MKGIFDLVIRFMAISAMLVGVSSAMVATASDRWLIEPLDITPLAIKQSHLVRAQTLEQSIRNFHDVTELNIAILQFVKDFDKVLKDSYDHYSGTIDYEELVGFTRWYGASNSRRVNEYVGVSSDSEKALWYDFALWRDILRGFITGSGGGSVDRIKKYVAVGVNVNATNQAGSTALHYAVHNGGGFNLEEIQYLVDIGADPTIRNKNDTTPLMLLVQGKTNTGVIDVATAEILVKKGANSNTQNLSGETILHIATHENKPGAVRNFLLAGANSDIGNKVNGETPLMHAAKKGFLDVAKVLFNGGANVRIKDKNGRTALDYAKRIGHPELVSLLQKAELASGDELSALRKKAGDSVKGTGKKKGFRGLLGKKSGTWIE